MKEKTNESFCVEQQLKFTVLKYKLGKKKFRIEKKKKTLNLKSCI